MQSLGHRDRVGLRVRPVGERRHVDVEGVERAEPRDDHPVVPHHRVAVRKHGRDVLVQTQPRPQERAQDEDRRSPADGDETLDA